MISKRTGVKDIEHFNNFYDRKTKGTVNLIESPFPVFSTENVRLFERDGALHLRGEHKPPGFESFDVALSIAPVEGSSSGEFGSRDIPYAWGSHRRANGSRAYFAKSGSFKVHFDKAKQHLKGDVDFISRDSSGEEFVFKFNFDVVGFDTKTPQNPDDTNATGEITATLSTNEEFKSIWVRFIPSDGPYFISTANALPPVAIDIIDLRLPENVEPKEYDFSDTGRDSVVAYFSHQVEHNEGTYPYTAYSGKLVVTKVDHLKPSFEGTFYFTCKDKYGDEISISDGKFEITCRSS